MKSNSILSLVCIVLGMLITACSGGTFLHEYYDTDLWGWNNDDTISFDLPIITSSGEVEAEVGVRFTNTYAYQDLILLGTLECNETPVQTDTIKVSIFKKNGANEGEGFPYTTTIQPATTFQVDSGQVYRYHLTHLMSPTPIKGITGIGLRLKSK